MKNNEQNVCYLCKSSDFEKLDGKVRDDEYLDVLKCKNCSLVFLSSFDHINECFYQESGMFGGEFDSEVDIQKWRKQTSDDDTRRFKYLKKELKNKKVLDFGCGNGEFLAQAKKMAKKVVGIELQESAKELLTKENFEIHSDMTSVSEKFDMITMFHVLEHIKDPIELLKELGSKLEKNGEIVIEVPNSEDALITLYKNYSFINFTYWSCHLFLFNEKTLSEIAEKAGYKIIYLNHIQRYGFSNHLWWQFFNKPGGHKKLWFLNIKAINRWYEKSLAQLKATDTIMISISRNDAE